MLRNQLEPVNTKPHIQQLEQRGHSGIAGSSLLCIETHSTVCTVSTVVALRTVYSVRVGFRSAVAALEWRRAGNRARTDMARVPFDKPPGAAPRPPLCAAFLAARPPLASPATALFSPARRSPLTHTAQLLVLHVPCSVDTVNSEHCEETD